jgi:hypothetical protein
MSASRYQLSKHHFVVQRNSDSSDSEVDIYSENENRSLFCQTTGFTTSNLLFLSKLRKEIAPFIGIVRIFRRILDDYRVVGRSDSFERCVIV